MPFITQGKTNWKFLLIVIILAVIVGGGALWFTSREKYSSIQSYSKKEAPQDNYSFQSFFIENSNEKYPGYSVGIYKNQALVKKIDIKNIYNEPSLFTLSQNKKYVAFKAAYAGGTCVYEEFPIVIDLNTFSRVNLNDEDIYKKIGDAFNMDFNDMIQFYSARSIDDIKWISNEKLRASIKFGNTSCPIMFYNKPANSPSEIETGVDFTIIK